MHTYAVDKPKIGKFSPQSINKFCSDIVYSIILGKLISLSLSAASSNRANVDESVSELDERASLHRKCYFRHVAQGKIDEFL